MKKIDLSWQRLDKKNVLQILEQTLDTLEGTVPVELTVACNCLEDEGVMILCNKLKNYNLQSINLSDNDFGLVGIKAVLELLNNTHLINLNISRNNIDNDCIKLISETLKDDNHLQELYLAENEFNDKAKEHIIAILQANKALNKFDISHNKITKTTLAEICNSSQAIIFEVDSDISEEDSANSDYSASTEPLSDTDLGGDNSQFMQDAEPVES